MVQVQETTNYRKFKTIKGNRPIDDNHVTALAKTILSDNRLAVNPIIVNERMEIVDGQHRLEVARNNRLPIYYLIDEGARLEQVQGQNSNTRAWVGRDYLHSYVTLGKPDYIKLKQVIDETGMNLSNAINVLSGFNFHDGWAQFKRGNFRVVNEELSKVVINELMTLKPYCSVRAWNDRDFYHAWSKVRKQIKFEELLDRFEKSGWTVESQIDSRSYIRRFEDIMLEVQEKVRTKIWQPAVSKYPYSLPAGDEKEEPTMEKWAQQRLKALPAGNRANKTRLLPKKKKKALDLIKRKGLMKAYDIEAGTYYWYDANTDTDYIDYWDIMATTWEEDLDHAFGPNYEDGPYGD